jgi:hypothetical protein
VASDHPTSPRDGCSGHVQIRQLFRGPENSGQCVGGSDRGRGRRSVYRGSVCSDVGVVVFTQSALCYDGVGWLLQRWQRFVLECREVRGPPQSPLPWMLIPCCLLRESRPEGRAWHWPIGLCECGFVVASALTLGAEEVAAY